MMTAKYAKLRLGDKPGILVEGSEKAVREGDAFDVLDEKGAPHREVVSKVIWTDRAGKFLCAIARAPSATTGLPKRRAPKGASK